MTAGARRPQQQQPLRAVCATGLLAAGEERGEGARTGGTGRDMCTLRDGCRSGEEMRRCPLVPAMGAAPGLFFVARPRGAEAEGHRDAGDAAGRLRVRPAGDQSRLDKAPPGATGGRREQCGGRSSTSRRMTAAASRFTVFGMDGCRNRGARRTLLCAGVCGRCPGSSGRRERAQQPSGRPLGGAESGGRAETQTAAFPGSSQ